MEVDGGAVGGHDFTCIRANQTGYFVPQALGQGEPARAVPGADEALTLLPGHDFCHASGSHSEQHTQGIAVKVDHTFRQAEMAAHWAQRVLRIQRRHWSR